LFFSTRTPVVTGSSVAAFVFNGGVILAADVLGSYGSLAKYRNLPRIHQVNDRTVLALSGDLSDADYIKEAIDSKVYVG
jgi:20S proteasome subunit beta 7